MNTHDTFGYSVAATRLSPISLSNTAYELAASCQRSSALLRLLHHRFLNEAPCKVDLHDIETVIELALISLPEVNDKAFSAIDQFDVDAHQTVRSLIQQQNALTALLDALEQAACPTISLQDLCSATDQIFAATRQLSDGERHWQNFCSLISARGLYMVWLHSSLSPEIHSAETLKAQHVTHMKMNEYIHAIRAESEPKPATAGKRKSRIKS